MCTGISFVDFGYLVNIFGSRIHSEKMRKITFSIWLLWLIIFHINAELTLESVAQEVHDLKVEVTTLKVLYNLSQ